MKLEKTIKRKGFLKKVTYSEVTEQNMPGNPKYAIREDVRKNVYDTEDAIADGFKMSLANTSLLLTIYTLVVNLYNDLDKSDELEEILPAEIKNDVDKLVTIFKESKTIYDLKVQEEGILNFVTRLLSRQELIANIIEKKTK